MAPNRKVFSKPVSCTMQFTHNKQSWDVNVRLNKGKWLVTVTCSGEVVETLEQDMDTTAQEVARQYVLDRFGKEYGLV